MVWGKKKKDAKTVDEPEELIDDEVVEEDWDDFVEEEEEVARGTRKQRALRSLRNSVIAALVLLVLAGGGGAAYIWYMDQNSPVLTAIAKPIDPVVHHEVKRLQRDPNAPFGVSIQMLSSPITPGSNAGVTIKSVANVTCKVIVEINKIPLKDSGLADKQTDEYGVMSWSWTVPTDAPLGTWPVKITCTSPAKKSAMVQGDMSVVKTLPEN
jgi:hypothetical protein